MDVSELPSAGRLYGYVGAVGGFALSFWANVRDAYIPEIPKDVAGDLWRPGYPGYHDVKPNGFDLVLAGFFPVALFVALELLTRVEWRDSKQHKALKWLGVGGLTLVAGIISYSHLRTGFLLAGWNTGMASLAPLAVDGFMLLCTTVLLMTGHPKVAHKDLGHRAQEMAHHLAQGVAHTEVLTAVGHPGPGAEPELGHSALGQAAHDETAGQGVAHEVAQVSDKCNVEVARDDVAQVAQNRPRATRGLAQTSKVGQPKTDPEKVAQAVDAVRSGRLTQRAAATEFGISRTTLQRAMTETELALTEEEVARLASGDIDAEFAEWAEHPNDET